MIGQLVPRGEFLVFSTAGYWQVPLIDAAKKAGFQTIAVDSDSSAPGLDIADYAIVWDIHDFEAVANQIEFVTKKISGAVSYCSDAGINLSNFLMTHFDCPKSLISNGANFTNKGIQRQLLRENGVLIPDFEIFSEISQAELFCNALSFPYVIKPVDSAGSRGVCIVTDLSQIKEAIANAFNFSNTGQIIIECYMPGDEYTLEVFALEGIIHPLLITKKVKVSTAVQTVASELWAVDINNPKFEQILNLGLSAFQSLNLKTGAGHIELIADGNLNPIGVVEAANRGGGFNLATKFIQRATGIDFVSLSLSPFTKEKFPAVTPKFNPGVLMFFPTQKGQLSAISGLDACSMQDGVEIEILATLGRVYNGPESDADRLCSVIVSAKKIELVQQKLQYVRNNLNFEFNL